MTAAATNAQSKQPLENARSLAAVGGGEALGQIQRHDHADQAGANALQQPAEHQRPIAVSQRDHRDAGHEENAAESHQLLAAHQVGQHAGKESRNDAPQQHRRYNEGELAGIQARGRLQVRQRAGNDPNVHSVEQTAQAGDQEQEAVVTGLGSACGRSGLFSRCIHIIHSHFDLPGCTGLAPTLARRQRRAKKNSVASDDDPVNEL